MTEWTEYNITMDWPEGDNFKWEVRLDGEWTETDMPSEDWDTGLRVRYRIPEVKTPAKMANQYAINYGNGSNPPSLVKSAAYFGFMNGWKAARENPEVEW